MSRGKRLKEAREAAQKTRRWLADKLGLTEQSVWRMETGKTPIREKYLERAAESLGVSHLWLAVGIDEKPVLDYPDVYSLWLASPEGKAATAEEREWIKGYKSDRKPTVASLSLMLAARRLEQHERRQG